MRGEVVVLEENIVPETDGNILKLNPHAIGEVGGLNTSLTTQGIQLWIFPAGHPSIY